jgi:polyphenol oxidase
VSGATASPGPAPDAEVVGAFRELGVTAFTTGRAAGSYGTQSDEPVRDVLARWTTLRSRLGAARLATAAQVHGDAILEHDGAWTGWLRGDAADGHLALRAGTAMAVTVADCVPVFVAHPSGASAILHSGWRGTVAGISERAILRMKSLGYAPGDLHVHLGPAICGACYEVSADVARQLTGRDPGRPVTVDLRALIANRLRGLGVISLGISPFCTRCDNERFYSHRAGDAGRQLAVLFVAG